MTDSKGLHDNLATELPNDDKASAAEALVIREFLDRMRGRIRWLPHDRNSADALTKFWRAHALLLWQLLKTGLFLLSPEDEAFRERAETRQELGYNPGLRAGIMAASRHKNHG